MISVHCFKDAVKRTALPWKHDWNHQLTIFNLTLGRTLSARWQPQVIMQRRWWRWFTASHWRFWHSWWRKQWWQDHMMRKAQAQASTTWVQSFKQIWLELERWWHCTIQLCKPSKKKTDTRLQLVGYISYIWTLQRRALDKAHRSCTDSVFTGWSNKRCVLSYCELYFTYRRTNLHTSTEILRSAVQHFKRAQNATPNSTHASSVHGLGSLLSQKIFVYPQYCESIQAPNIFHCDWSWFCWVAFPASDFLCVADTFSSRNNGCWKMVLSAGNIGHPMISKCSSSKYHLDSAVSDGCLHTHISPCCSNVGTNAEAIGLLFGFWFRFITIPGAPPEPRDILWFLVPTKSCAI